MNKFDFTREDLERFRQEFDAQATEGSGHSNGSVRDASAHLSEPDKGFVAPSPTVFAVVKGVLLFVLFFGPIVGVGFLLCWGAADNAQS